MKNPYLPKKVKIIDYHRETSDSFTITVDWKVKHDPGQFVQISILGIGEAPISVGSYSKDYMQFNIRQVGNVTNALAKLKKGGHIFVRGPFGKGYPMKEFEGKDIVIIGGGCGVAPLKGAIEYLEKKRKNYGEIFMFIGYRSPSDIIFKKKINTWKKKFKTRVSVDSIPKGTCFNGPVGFITNEINKTKLSPKNKVAFICGPPIMMKKSIEILKKKGFHDNQIYLSTERMMNCAIGICGHCMIHGKYTCIDGPVFRYDEIKDYKYD